MASTVAAQTEDFARRLFQVVEELGRDGDWVTARDAFERTVAVYADHPYVAYIQGHRARKAGLSAVAERVREAEFPQIERRKAGTRRNAPVFYRANQPKLPIALQLPYAVPPSHPLRAATQSGRGNPLRRESELRETRSPWRRRLGRRRTSPDVSSAEPQWWQKLADGAAGLLDMIIRVASRRQG